jgi:hypothetical protein
VGRSVFVRVTFGRTKILNTSHVLRRCNPLNLKGRTNLSLSYQIFDIKNKLPELRDIQGHPGLDVAGAVEVVGIQDGVWIDISVRAGDFV